MTLAPPEPDTHLRDAPTYFSAPPAADYYLGDATVRLCASVGLILDPWQELCVRTILAEDAEGHPAAFEAAIIVARQNGKGSVLEALCLGWLFLTDAPLIMHSAHEFKTAAEGFRRLRALILNTPHLTKRLAPNGIRTAAGNESIELKTGQRLRYVARSKGSGRGFTGGKVILDEAYELNAEDMDALIPVMSTRPEAQVVYTSSAGMATSAKLRVIRDRGRAGGDPSLAYAEWGGVAYCSPGCEHGLEDPLCRLNDRAEWRRANPGSRIFQSFIEKERRALSPEGFARERLGLWDEPLGEAPIAVAEWSLCGDLDSVITSQPVLAIDVSPGLQSAAVTAAGWREDGLAHVEVIRHQPGVEWVTEYVRGVVDRQNPAKLVLIGSSPARSLVPDLEAAGLTVEKLGDVETAAACSAFQAEITSGRLRHLSDPLLRDALAGSARKDVGDGGWTWRRKTSSADICPLVAVTVARWALTSVPIEPDLEALLQSFG